ncbi:MAG: hypothetical protein PVI26_10040, partial [Chitinispirillia bacterium]
METKHNPILKPVILPAIISALLFFNSYAKIDTKTNPFSVSALEYLLNGKEYARFDWYVRSYLRQYPDSAILHILKGYRYFNQAFDSRSSKISRINDKTGGIPRKYPGNFIRYIPYDNIHLKFTYNEKLLKKAFKSMKIAKSLEPERSDTYLGICHMATRTGQIDLLSREIHNSNEKFGYIDKIEEVILNTFRTDGKSIENDLKIKILQILLQINPDNKVIETELGKYHYAAGNIDSSCSIMIFSQFCFNNLI